MRASVAAAMLCIATVGLVAPSHAQNMVFPAHAAFSFGELHHVFGALCLNDAATLTLVTQKGNQREAMIRATAAAIGKTSKMKPSVPNKMHNFVVADRTVIDAFKTNAAAAQSKLLNCLVPNRAATLPTFKTLAARLPALPKGRKYVLLWIRKGTLEPERNTEAPEMNKLMRFAIADGLVPVLMGEPDAALDGLIADLNGQYKDLRSHFRIATLQSLPEQWAMFYWFGHNHNRFVGQVGYLAGGMDGGPLLDFPTVQISPSPNKARMSRWNDPKVPGYRCLPAGGVWPPNDATLKSAITTIKDLGAKHSARVLVAARAISKANAKPVVKGAPKASAPKPQPIKGGTK